MRLQMMAGGTRAPENPDDKTSFAASEFDSELIATIALGHRP